MLDAWWGAQKCTFLDSAGFLLTDYSLQLQGIHLSSQLEIRCSILLSYGRWGHFAYAR
jgi:hypothetical protein